MRRGDPGERRRWSLRRKTVLGLAVLLLALCGAAAVYWREDILRTALDPKQPYQTYVPPPSPDYEQARAWALRPDPLKLGATAPPADIFFIHPTTFDGGRDWNGPIDDARARQRLTEEVLPNFAAPFARAGRVFAPRYRQASLYATLTLRDDARDARRFAYRDVRAAFDTFVARWNGGRPIVIVGVEQGGLLAERLADDVAREPVLAARLAAVYLIDTTAPADAHGVDSPLPACASPRQVRCVVAYQPARQGDFTAQDRLVGHAARWTARGELEPFKGAPLCVNPVTGAIGIPAAPEAASLGAAAATRLEWGLRPALLAGQVSAQCKDGLLRVSRARSPALHRSGGWADRLREPPFNLFWADLEADAARRVRAFVDAPRPAAPITQVVEVGKIPRPR